MKTTLLERMLIPRKIRLSRLRNQVISFLEAIPADKISREESEVLNYLKKHGLTVFPYAFADEYDSSQIEIEFDSDLNLLYMVWEGKKLYYANGKNIRKAKRYFNSLLIEQDYRSPHRYLQDNFDVDEGDIIADIGAAEGNFSLSNIEKAKHVFLFEPDSKWIPALEATFAPWQQKVTIINKFVSSKTGYNCVCLNDFFSNQHLDFVKADIEGAEIELLRGGNEIIRDNERLKIAICTYHNQGDGLMIEAFLKTLGFRTEFSSGFMIYYYGRENVVKEPYLRRGIMRAKGNLAR